MQIFNQIPTKQKCKYCVRPSPIQFETAVLLQNVSLGSPCLQQIHQLGFCANTFCVQVPVDSTRKVLEWDQLLQQFLKVYPSCCKILCIEGNFTFHQMQNWIQQCPFDKVSSSDQKQSEDTKHKEKGEQLVLLSYTPLVQSPLSTWNIFLKNETHVIPATVSCMVIHADYIPRVKGETLDMIAKNYISQNNKWVTGVWPCYGSETSDDEGFTYTLCTLALLLVFPLLFYLFSSWLLYSVVSSKTVTKLVLLVLFIGLLTFLIDMTYCKVGYSSRPEWFVTYVINNAKQAPQVAWEYVEKCKNYFTQTKSS
jgi:hypothetical protein